MDLFLSYIIFGLSIISLFLGFSYLKEDKNNKVNRYYFLTTLGSTIWGLGFGFLLIQNNVINALYCRAFGMIGVFLYAIFGIKIFTSIANTPDKLKKIISFISYFAVILYPFVVMPERQEFHMEYFGMSYTFSNDIWNTLYNVYSVFILILFVGILIRMRKDSVLKRQIILNNKLWLFFICFCGGTVFDTVLPMLGIGAFPGSTLSQFVAIFIVYYALMYEKKNSLSLENISNHLYHSIEMPILVFNQDFKVQFVSDAAYNYFYIDKGSEFDIELDDLFVLKPEDKAFFFDGDVNKEFFVKHSDAFCSVTVEKIRDSYDDIVGYIMLVTDLTEKNKFITELTKAKEIAEESSKSKDNFLANMSHEIRTPLNAIVGVNELIANEKNIKKIKKYSKQIDFSSKNLLGIVDDLFDFSNLQSGKLKIIEKQYNLINLINSIVDLYKAKIEEKSLEIDISIDKFIPELLIGDEVKIKQCIVNLLKNAIKYTNQGSISIDVYGELINSNMVNVIVEVTDTGIGIKDEDVEKIFKPFSGLESTDNRTFDGTGLGLTIVKELMSLMNGSLQIQSEYGLGSTFVLSFPQRITTEESIVMIDNMEVIQDESNTEINNLIKKVIPKAKLLIVDDNNINLMVLKEFLVEYEAEVDACKSGVEALEKSREISYDMVFLDYMMPGMDGIETLKEIRKQKGATKENIPIVVVTANAAPGAREFYLENGFDDYISKPIDNDLLEGVLFKYLPEELIEYKGNK